VQPSGNIKKWLDSPVNEEPRQLHASVHHPNGGAQHRFDEGVVRELVLKWQDSREPELIEEILRRCEPALAGTILARGGYSADFNETLNALRIRLWRRLPKFDPSRGRIFTFVSLVAGRSLIEIWSRRNLQARRYPEIDISVLESIRHSSWSRISPAEALEDVWHRIMQVRTTCTDEHELSSQRWLVKGLLDAGFQLRRHHASDSMCLVFGLPAKRARVLHDQTLLEVRRQLLDVVQVPKITTENLIGLRQFALAKYAPQLSSKDFSRLIFLMRNLAPAIIPRPDRIDLILNGFPGARPLFDQAAQG